MSDIFKLVSATGDHVKKPRTFSSHGAAPPLQPSVMVLKIGAQTLVTNDFVLSVYCESDEPPQHGSIEFCPCYSFPTDLEVLRHSGQLSPHGL